MSWPYKPRNLHLTLKELKLSLDAYFSKTIVSAVAIKSHKVCNNNVYKGLKWDDRPLPSVCEFPVPPPQYWGWRGDGDGEEVGVILKKKKKIFFVYLFNSF